MFRRQLLLTFPLSMLVIKMNTVQAKESKALVIYYSRHGENYWNGGTKNLSVGNTEHLANFLASALNTQAVRIEEAPSYPLNYWETTEVVQDELSKKTDHGYKPVEVDLSRYDTILIGHPIWWGQLPPPLVKSIKDHQAELKQKKV